MGLKSKLELKHISPYLPYGVMLSIANLSYILTAKALNVPEKGKFSFVSSGGCLIVVTVLDYSAEKIDYEKHEKGAFISE